MKTRIYYFSSTGNSLHVSRVIASGLKDTEIIPIPSVIEGKIETDSTDIGLVFPVYAWGPAGYSRRICRKAQGC